MEYMQERYSWFYSYLTGKKQQVIISHVSSNKFAAATGVQQGSHRAPLLFDLFINDVVLLIPKFFHMQKKMHLKISKCKHIQFGKLKEPLKTAHSINNNLLEKANLIKDLGIMFDNTLTFAQHIQTICSKVLRMLGFVKRHTSNFKNILAIRTLYVALVTSEL